MSKKATFNNDLEWGNHFEISSITLIERLFTKVLKKENKKLLYCGSNNSTSLTELKKYDTIYGVYDEKGARLKTLTFEIKTDKYPSNNAFIERTCSKKLSGVFKTEADYFIYIMPLHQENNFFIIKPEHLIEMLNKGQYHLTSGGDGNRVTGYLVDRNEFVADFKNAGGLVKTYNLTIPDKFNACKMATATKKDITISNLSKMKEYPDPFDWSNRN